MAASEEPFDDLGRTSETLDTPWRPGEAVFIREVPAGRADWIRMVLGLFGGFFGRRAPVSPA